MIMSLLVMFLAVRQSSIKFGIATRGLDTVEKRHLLDHHSQ